MSSNEDANIEYKRELTNKLKREVVSFLNNSTGGVIYLGVDDRQLWLSADTGFGYNREMTVRLNYPDLIRNFEQMFKQTMTGFSGLS